MLSDRLFHKSKVFWRIHFYERWAETRRLILLLICIGVAPFIWKIPRKLLTKDVDQSVGSGWVMRVDDHFLLVPKAHETNLGVYSNPGRYIDPDSSPFLMSPNSDRSNETYSGKKPEGGVKTIKIGYQDPKGVMKSFGRTDFSECEYDKCEMTENKGSSDVVIFLVARLTREKVPSFKRKPGQLWLLKTDEAPSRFTWFESLNRTGLKEQFNLTLTHRLDSDIPVVYGRLMEKDRVEAKDYGAIFDSKTKMAAWFVSHCPVRSRRRGFVELMKHRIEVDVFGGCGNLTCGDGAGVKQPGVVSMRQEADKMMCFPMLSKDYMFYLAFENSLCREYVTEKFFKMFNNVDVVPVVRGGADYKTYFPSDMFVDASDFDTPYELADFLDDLAKDRERYISYLKAKDRYVMVTDFPAWQCKLCEKLHVADNSGRWYPNVHHWWTHDTCHNPDDSAEFV